MGTLCSDSGVAAMIPQILFLAILAVLSIPLAVVIVLTVLASCVVARYRTGRWPRSERPDDDSHWMGQ